MSLFGRQDVYDDPNLTDNDDDGWYSDKAEIAKYVVVAVILGIILIWLIGGSWHAQRRLRKGQQPLFYHRWLVSSRNRQPYVQGQPGYYAHDARTGQPLYQMQDWTYAPPPPSYGYDAPPQYQAPPGPPPGASKVNPNQTIGATEVAYPPGSPGPSSGADLQQPAPTQPAPSSQR